MNHETFLGNDSTDEYRQSHSLANDDVEDQLHVLEENVAETDFEQGNADASLDESSIAVATDTIEDDNMDASASMFETGIRAAVADSTLTGWGEDPSAFLLEVEQWNRDNACFHVGLPPLLRDRKKPSGILQAWTQPEWKNASITEFGAFVDCKSWDVIDRPSGELTIVQLIPLFSFKPKADGIGYICKARFVANGAKLVGAPGTPETYSGTPSREALRLFLHVAVNRGLEVRVHDIRSAYLEAPLNSDSDILLRPFPGFELLCQHFRVPYRKGQLLKPNSAVYGLPQAGRCWSKEYSAFMTRQGLSPFDSEPSLFYRLNPFLLVLAHVDDNLSAADAGTQDTFQTALTDRFNIKVLGTLGVAPIQFLGMEISRPIFETITVSQQGYIDQLIADTGLSSAKPQSTPATREKLGFTVSPLLDAEAHHRFRVLSGGLLYALLTRFDIALAVTHVCSWSSAPTEVRGRSKTNFAIPSGDPRLQTHIPQARAATFRGEFVHRRRLGRRP